MAAIRYVLIMSVLMVYFLNDRQFFRKNLSLIQFFGFLELEMCQSGIIAQKCAFYVINNLIR